MLRLSLVSLAVGMFVFSSIASAVDITHTKDDLDTVKAKVAEKKAIIVDVRSEDEWKEGHVKGAIHFPIADLQGQVDQEKLKTKMPKDKIVYTYCAVGGRSLKAGKILKELGYDVRPLKPGFEAIAKAGFETEVKREAEPSGK